MVQLDVSLLPGVTKEKLQDSRGRIEDNKAPGFSGIS